MSDLFDETEADAAVINVLLREIINLRSSNTVSKIIVSTDGTIYRVEHFEILSTEEVADIKQELESELLVLNSASVTPAPIVVAEVLPVTDAALPVPVAPPAPQVIADVVNPPIVLQ